MSDAAADSPLSSRSLTGDEADGDGGGGGGGELLEEDFNQLSHAELVERCFELKQNLCRAAEFGMAMQDQLVELEQLKVDNVCLVEEKDGMGSQLEEAEWRVTELEQTVQNLQSALTGKERQLASLTAELAEAEDAGREASEAVRVAAAAAAAAAAA
eukprot:SAG22_NODE_4587_length_1224_cov_3.362667_1_plen_156_part_10